jgi:hypothetical protein
MASSVEPTSTPYVFVSLLMCSRAPSALRFTREKLLSYFKVLIPFSLADSKAGSAFPEGLAQFETIFCREEHFPLAFKQISEDEQVSFSCF